MQMGLDWTGLIHSSIRSTTDVAPIDTCRLADDNQCRALPTAQLDSAVFNSTLIDKLLRLHAIKLLYLQYGLICLISTKSAQSIYILPVRVPRVVFVHLSASSNCRRR